MRLITVVTCVGTAAVLSGVARAEIEGEIHLGYGSMYEFRGVNLGDNQVEAGADVAWTYNDYKLSAGLWYSDVSDNPLDGTPGGFASRAGANELDLYGAIERDFEVRGRTMTVALGVTHYTFPDGSQGLSPINEPYLAFTSEVWEGISTSFTSYWGTSNTNPYFADGSKLSGWWFDLNASYSRDLCERASVELAVGITYSGGYNQSDDGFGFDGFDHVYAALTTPVTLTDNVTLNPFIKGVGNIAGDSRNYFIGGISLNVSW